MASTKLSIQPLGGNVLVEPLEPETTTASGIVIAATAKGEKPQQGKIAALGTGKLDKDGKKLDWNVKVGDKVLFRKYSPDEVEMDGKTYLVMKEEDILAVISN